jgi:hypothetical protein
MGKWDTRSLEFPSVPTDSLLFLYFACKLLILWWAQQDSNLRLPPCEGGTLPLSYAPWSRGMLLRLSYASRITSPSSGHQRGQNALPTVSARRPQVVEDAFGRDVSPALQSGEQDVRPTFQSRSS